jgi:hypothetical protein
MGLLAPEVPQRLKAAGWMRVPIAALKRCATQERFALKIRHNEDGR